MHVQMDGRSALAGKILDLPHSQSGRAIMLVQTAAKERAMVVGFDDDREMSRVEKALLSFQVHRNVERRSSVTIRCVVFVFVLYA